MIELNCSFHIDLRLSVNAKPLSMLWISPGTFMMGNRENEPGYDSYGDEPIFLATVSRGFWIGQYLVTQAHWQSVMGCNPSHFQDDNLDLPVETINWYEATTFCEELNKRFANELPRGYRFNLPTEMQWEYACRAGTQTPFYSGSSENDLARVAWYASNSGDQTHPVGEKDANAWGLYDMHGNVLEWCYDAYLPYPTVPITDWIGEGKDIVRVIRGGGWRATYADGGQRSGYRGGGQPDIKQSWIGFRLCLRWSDVPQAKSL